MTRVANDAGLQGVQAAFQAGQLSQRQIETYTLLWHSGPLSMKEVNAQAQGYDPTAKPMWAAQLKKLAAMGLVAPQKVGRSEKWDVTAAAAPAAVPPPAKKPSAKRFAKGVQDLELLYIKHQHLADMLSTPEAEAVLSWLKGKV